jgi:hypothetical protein
VKTLAGHRANKADDCTVWSVEEMLRELLLQIESGEWKPTNALLLWNQDEAGEHVDHGWWAANVDARLGLWMLETSKLERLLEKV